jgi:hypothetical protein
MATSFSGGGSQNTRRKPPTLGKQLVNCIKSWSLTRAVFVIGLYELLDPTTYLIETPGPLLWKNEVDYGTVVYELCFMEHVTSTKRMVAYGYLWLYINYSTQGQIIIPPQQGRWTWLMAVLVSLQPSVTENPLDTIWNSCHYQFKFKKKS